MYGWLSSEDRKPRAVDRGFRIVEGVEANRWTNTLVSIDTFDQWISRGASGLMASVQASSRIWMCATTVGVRIHGPGGR